MVVVLETWKLVGDRGPDWAEALVSDEDVNLEKERKTEIEIKNTSISSINRLRIKVLRRDPRDLLPRQSEWPVS